MRIHDRSVIVGTIIGSTVTAVSVCGAVALVICRQLQAARADMARMAGVSRRGVAALEQLADDRLVVDVTDSGRLRLDQLR